MKTRQEYNEIMKEITAPQGTAETARVICEILLDIRELLEREHSINLSKSIRESHRDVLT